MATKSPKTLTKVHKRQKDYIEKLEKENFQYGLAVGGAFVRGMRQVGYKHSGKALDEFIDNSFEAGATHVHVVVTEANSGRKGSIGKLAIIDDGCGMIPDMIRVSVLWGGTDREGSRTGLGRYGYGLPSAAVNLGKRYEVYSQPEGGELHMCYVDLDEIESGKYSSRKGEIVVPEATAAELPDFVQAYIDENMGGKWTKGTIVVIDKIDQPTWRTVNGFRNNIMEHFGVIYHKLCGDFRIVVNGTKVEPIDPLFLTPGYRWYDIDADRAIPLDPVRIPVKDKETQSVIGDITVRYSYMPPTFGVIDKTKGWSKANSNPRFSIMKEYNGFIISRMGRIIDVIAHTDFTTFVNYDRFVKVEIDFDAKLDEHFSVPTTKQTVAPSERIWEMLKEHGVDTALTQMRKIHKESRKSLVNEQDNGKAGKRASELAMEAAAAVSPPLPEERAEKLQELGQKRLKKAAEKVASETGKPVEQAMKEIESEFNGAFKVAKRSVAGGVFFDVEQLGGTLVLWLNTASRFFQEVYAGPDSSPSVRTALEILLFSIGKRKLRGGQDAESFYIHEIPAWSQEIEFALSKISQSLHTNNDDEEDQLFGLKLESSGEVDNVATDDNLAELST